jgi:hypothetical protein
VARRSKTLPLRIDFVTLWRLWCTSHLIPRPRTGNATRLYHQLGLGSSAFARRYSRSHCCFLLLRVLRCFNSPGSLLTPYLIQAWVTPHDGCGVSPFGHPRINALSATPRGFSQPDTSFIGARRQGIHRWLFVAWKNKDARARYAILKWLERERRRLEEPASVLAAHPENGRDDGRHPVGGSRGNCKPSIDPTSSCDGNQCTNWESVWCWYQPMDSLERR